jgi:hypothetical protein
VNIYLLLIKRFWPIEELSYSQELALEFLMNNDYNFEKAMKMVKAKEKNFTNFIKGKQTKCMEK